MEIEMIRIMKTMKNNQPTLFLLEKQHLESLIFRALIIIINNYYCYTTRSILDDNKYKFEN